MPKGSNGQKRPAEAIGCAVMVGQLANGEISEELREPSVKARAASEGGKARAASMTAEQRSENARRAAAGRWS